MNTAHILMYLHLSIDLIYVLIGVQAFIYMAHTKSSASKKAFAAFISVFILCAITRYFMAFGANGWLSILFNAVLLISAAAFFFMNQVKVILRALDD